MRQFIFVTEEDFERFANRDNVGVRYLGSNRFLVDYRTAESDKHPAVYVEKEPLTFMPAPEDQRKEVLSSV